MKYVGKVLYGKFKEHSINVNDSGSEIWISQSMYHDKNQADCIIGKKISGKPAVVAWEKYEEIQTKANMGKIVGSTALFGVVGAVVSSNTGKGVKYNVVVEYDDGEKSLLQMEQKGYEVFLSVGFGLKKEVTVPIKEASNSNYHEKREIYINEEKLEVSLKRANLFLEEKDWKTAADYYNAILDVDPEYEPAYTGLLCSELQISSENELINQQKSLNEYTNYKYALRFADAQRKEQLLEYENIRENENWYKSGVKLFDEGLYQEAINNFEKVIGYKDSNEYINKSIDKYDINREQSYNEAMQLMQKGNYNLALKKFQEASGWKDADIKIKECKNRIAKIEANKKKKAEEARRERDIKDKKRNIVAITIGLIAVLLLVTVTFFAMGGR